MTPCSPAVYDTTPSQGFSEAANFVEKQMDRPRDLRTESEVLGWDRKLIAELGRVGVETQTPNWDGYGGATVAVETLVRAYLFVAALPEYAREPSVGAEPDGHVTLEWYRAPRRVLSISVSPEGDLCYAALLGASKRYGTEPFYGSVSEDILRLIDCIELA
jgi:hypothetical protein